MDGVLVIDKPVGPTSHDIVARARRALGEPRVGHTGTLDPGASGVLPLVLGKATRLARFLSSRDKSYDAVIRLGSSTDTGDAEGTSVGHEYGGTLPTRDAIDAALGAFRGRFLQQPPVFSAKKIDGHRSYRLARAAARLTSRTAPGTGHATRATGSSASDTRPAPLKAPAPVAVTAHSLVILSVEGNQVTLRVECSAGFYVRALAHDLGERLGTGAHLASLRRIRSGEYGLADAIPIDAIERNHDAAVAGLVPLALMLPRWPFVVLTPEGVTRARHGRALGPSDLAPGGVPADVVARIETPPLQDADGWVRLLAPEGGLVGLARAQAGSGLLHPSVVLI